MKKYKRMLAVVASEVNKQEVFIGEGISRRCTRKSVLAASGDILVWKACFLYIYFCGI